MGAGASGSEDAGGEAGDFGSSVGEEDATAGGAVLLPTTARCVGPAADADEP